MTEYEKPYNPEHMIEDTTHDISALNAFTRKIGKRGITKGLGHATSEGAFDVLTHAHAKPPTRPGFHMRPALPTKGTSNVTHGVTHEATQTATKRTSMKNIALGGAAVGIVAAAVPFGIITGTHVAESDKKRTECKEECPEQDTKCYTDCDQRYPEETMACKVFPCPSSYTVDNIIKTVQICVAAFILWIVSKVVLAVMMKSKKTA